MRRLIELVLGFFSGPSQTPTDSRYDDRFVPLDAEALAEGGIKERYEELLPELRKYVSDQVEIEEELGEYSDFYVVRANGREYRIYDDPDEQRSWGYATFAFFEILNENLADASVNFYALYGGNDLAGMFLTSEEMEEIRATTSNRQAWPYRPSMEDPWYGQFH
ncbi:MAG: hypothetical protein JWL86_2002 [Rhizobium sp.]|nr:hypothetical protein [Rhizobium sp.]